MVQQEFVQDDVQPRRKNYLEPADIRTRSRSSDSTCSEASVSSVSSIGSTHSEGSMDSTKRSKSRKSLAKKMFKKHEKKNILMTNTLLSYMSVDS